MMVQESLTFVEKPTHYEIPVYTVALVRESTLSQLQRPQIRTAADAAAIFSAYLANADREHLVVMLLNSQNRIIGINTVSVGHLSSSMAHPREILKPAILANAAAFVLGHNHPSGEVTPSAADVEITKRVFAAGDLLGIRLLDHVIIAEDGRWYSFQEDGVLYSFPPWRSSL